MGKVYSIGSAPEIKINECRPFDVQINEIQEYPSTYAEILRVLKEVFSLVDFTQIIKK